MVYYAAASLGTWRRTGSRGELHRADRQPRQRAGRGLGAALGLPIGELVLAFNANRTVPDYLASGAWRPRPTVATLASAMDVGNPSNMERLRHLHADWRELAGR